MTGLSTAGCGSETSDPEENDGQSTSSGSGSSTASSGASSSSSGTSSSSSGASSSSTGEGGSGSGEGGSGSGEGGAGGEGGSGSGEGGSASGTGGSSPGGADFRLYGYATTDGGTTGGKGGAVVSVSSLDALRTEAAKDEALIIQITGKISGGDDDVDVASNKTIVGVGSSGELEGIGLNLRRASNIIIRNLKIHHVLAGSGDGNGDGIHMDESHNVWIDHCELWAESPAVNSNKDKYDGLIDATHESSNITISWTYLHDHWKGMLVGSSDNDDSDRRITFHHNYINNVNSRLPSYRGGNGHVFNNYFENVPTSGVNSRVGACLRVEGNHFYKVKNPITTLDSDAGGTDRKDNIFEETTGTQASGADCTWAAPYDYPLARAAEVKAIVLAHAGVGKTDPLENLP
ncbi:pectate lyase family protein [Sorangium sp. So ce861]|uniref:pectate lyase family protein n=1 Tax=Sorangium sp. So ce861 TaxID=3133323 RepID=UPI003F62FF34